MIKITKRKWIKYLYTLGIIGTITNTIQNSYLFMFICNAFWVIAIYLEEEK